MATKFHAQKDIALKVAPNTKFTGLDAIPVYAASGSAGAKKSSGGDPLWMDLLNVINTSGKVVTNQLANWTDGKFDWKTDVPKFGRHSNNFKTLVGNQLGYWKDGTLDKNDIIGGWSKTVGDMAGFDQSLKNLGVKNEKALFWGGLVGDIAFDPTTYLTLGAGSAIKAGSKAAQTTAKVLGKEAGVTVAAKNGYKTAAESISNKIYTDTLKRTGDEIAANAAQKTAFETASKAINDAASKARFTAQNAIGSFDVPFTNITFQFGKKPANLTKGGAKVGAGGKAITRNMDKIGLTGQSATGFLQKSVGKTSVEDLTLQEFRFVQSELGRYDKFIKANPPKANPFAPADIEKLSSELASTSSHRKTASQRAKLREKTALLDEMKLQQAIPQKNPLDDFDASKFVPDMGGLSPLGQKVADKFTNLNPRQVGLSTAGAVANDAGNAIQDTNNRIRASIQRQLEIETKSLQKEIGKFKDFTASDKKAVEYLLEGNRPPSSASDYDVVKVTKAVDLLRDRYKTIAKLEQEAGALSKTTDNYAPHVINMDESKMEEILSRYADDPELQQLARMSSSNSFDQSRKSFKSFAQLDNYMAAVGADLAKATDPEEVARLQQKLDDVGNLFERDPFKAFQKRLHKSYKVREMSKLHRTLQEDGLIINPNVSKVDKILDNGNFKTLDRVEAKKLNLEVGTKIQNDVYKALLESNKIFSEAGLNKFVENLSSITNIWKTLVTAIRPVHHVNNLMGNIFNNGLAGVDARAYRKSSGILNRHLYGKQTPADMKLMQEALDAGIFGQAHSDEYRRLFNTAGNSKLRQVENFVSENPVTSFMRKWLGDSTDNWTRLAHYISVKERTGSSKLAAESVRKYLFNYGEQTAGDRFARLLIPFWNWTKRNIPLQVEQLMKQPRYYQTYLRLQDASYESQGESRQDQTDFISESYFRTPWGSNRDFRLPVTDLNNALNGSLTDAAQFTTSSLTPALRIPIELAVNKQLFSGNVIDKEREYRGGSDPVAQGKYALGQLGIFNDIAKVLSGQTKLYEMFLGRDLPVE